MSIVPFQEAYHPSESPDKGLVVVVYGLNPIPGQLDKVVKHFAADNDVFSYTYGNEVVSTGDPHELPSFIQKLGTRIEDISTDYDHERIRTVGASLGACMALNIHDRLQLTQAGVYATAGINVAKNLMYNPVFRLFDVPQRMRRAGHSTKDVRAIWKDIDIDSDRTLNDTTRFWANASLLDPVVWYPFVKPNLDRLNCHLQRSTALGHTATINEMVNHIAEATEVADNIKPLVVSKKD